MVPKDPKEGTHWTFIPFVLLQKLKNTKGGPFENIQKIR